MHSVNYKGINMIGFKKGWLTHVHTITYKGIFI